MKFLKYLLVAAALLSILAWIVYFFFLKPTPPKISEEDRAEISLIPLPQELELTGGSLELSESIGVVYSGPADERVDRSVARFISDMKLVRSNESGTSLELIALSSERYPSVNSDESYDLEVASDKITIKAASNWGLIYGLESLKQLRTEEGIPKLKMRDFPRFPWRGLMIDAGRHWIPKSIIIENLDAMVMAKLNVLHWHLSEYQGFRIESKVYPLLHEKGSAGYYYTQEEVQEIIEYAADRAIRVVPEFDLPGHATSWFAGYPELASKSGTYSIDTVLIGLFEPVMDPTRDEVYEFLSNFFKEMTDLFPDKYFHIGGDEVIPKHWNESERIQQFIQENDLEDHHGLQNYFNKRLQRILANYGRIMMGWEEIQHPELPSEGILVQSWKSRGTLWEAAKAGNSALLSNGFYLDYKQPAGTHYEVDPYVIPGGVTIDIDTINWESWDLTLTRNTMEIPATLYMFGEPLDRGIVTLMDGDVASFEQIQVEGDNLSFEIESPFGTVSWELERKDQSVSGKASISIISLEVSGTQSGHGLDPSARLPEFKKIDPLSEEEELRILGGEACMWTEMVDSVTVNSRIWPRSGAIAERMWSSPEMANDQADMYRRLIAFNDRLENFGFQHESRINQLAADLVSEADQEAMLSLIQVLEEDQFFNRMVLYPDNRVTLSTRFSRLVDAARAESLVAYEFGTWVDAWSTSGDEQAETRIRNQLDEWIDLQAQLGAAFTSNSAPEEARFHSQHLLLLSKAALAQMNGDLADEERQKFAQLALKASEPQSAVKLAVASHLGRLIQGGTDR